MFEKAYLYFVVFFKFSFSFSLISLDLQGVSQG